MSQHIWLVVICFNLIASSLGNNFMNTILNASHIPEKMFRVGVSVNPVSSAYLWKEQSWRLIISDRGGRIVWWALGPAESLGSVGMETTECHSDNRLQTTRLMRAKATKNRTISTTGCTEFLKKDIMVCCVKRCTQCTVINLSSVFSCRPLRTDYNSLCPVVLLVADWKNKLKDVKRGPSNLWSHFLSHHRRGGDQM